MHSQFFRMPTRGDGTISLVMRTRNLRYTGIITIMPEVLKVSSINVLCTQKWSKKRVYYIRIEFTVHFRDEIKVVYLS